MMTVEEAIARMGARWAHAPVDVRDVAERVAARLGDGEPETFVVATPPAARLFVRRSDGVRWTSCYVHAVAEVDPALDLLLERRCA